MKANNYEVVEAGEVITFQGLVQRSASQAYFLVFCTLLGMASLALVLQIQFQDLGELTNRINTTSPKLLPCVQICVFLLMCLALLYSSPCFWKTKLVLSLPSFPICRNLLLAIR